MTASLLPLLDVAPLLGRTFTAEEERPDGPHAVILGESVWRDRFAARNDVIGRTLVVNSVPREIVGVMPARFAFPTADTRVWLPVRPTSGSLVGDFAYSGVARLAPGVTVAQAQREFAMVLPRMADAFPRLESGGSTATWLAELGPTPVVVPLRDELTGGVAQLLWMLAAASGRALPVACLRGERRASIRRWRRGRSRRREAGSGALASAVGLAAGCGGTWRRLRGGLKRTTGH